MADEVIYRSDHVLEYPFVRSVGPVIGAFLTGLRDGKVVGTRGSGGRVIVPPTEYDPETGEETSGVVEVGPGRDGHLVVVGAPAAAQAPAADAVRLGAGALRRRRHRVPARARRLPGPTRSRPACRVRPQFRPRTSASGTSRTSATSWRREVRREPSVSR